MVQVILKANIWLARVYVLSILILGIHCLGFSLLPILNCSVIVVLLAARWKRKAPFAWCPDGLLFGLPFFWALNSFLSVYGTKGSLIPAHLLVFSLTTLVFGPSWIKGKEVQTKLSRGILFSLLFILSFFTALKNIFAPFSQQTYQLILLQMLLFYGGIPVSQVAGIGWKGSGAKSID